MPPHDANPDAGAMSDVPQGQPMSAPVSGLPLGAGEAIIIVPQGQNTVASPVSIPLEEAKATNNLPRGRRDSADASSSPIPSAEARTLLPQGQTKGASALRDPFSSAGANVRLPKGQAAAAPALEEICGNLMGLQRDRRFAISQQIRCNNATGAYIRTRLGFSVDLDEAERKKLRSRAAAIKKAIERDGVPPEGAPDVTRVVMNGLKSRAAWDEMRTEIERDMERLAAQTPGARFVAETPGLALKGLAVIVGEAGNLADYPKKGHLWKRLGLAVIDGRRQGSVPKGMSAEDRAAAWIERKYNPSRRAEIYAFIDDALFRAQKAGTKYRVYYERKKAEYIAREVHYPDRCARRAMTKMVIRDLWKAWRNA